MFGPTNNEIVEQFLNEWYQLRSHNSHFAVSDFRRWLNVHYPSKVQQASVMILHYTMAGERLNTQATTATGKLKHGFRPKWILGCTGLGPYAKHFPMGAEDVRDSIRRQVREKSDAIINDMKRRAQPAAISDPNVLRTVGVLRRGIETRFEEIASLLQII